jgi:hypothetical protein
MTEPRRFNDEEVRAIFERAADRQEQANSASRQGNGDAPGGLSLEELQEIGRTAGIDPDHIAAAAEGIARGALARRSGSGVPARPTAPSGKPLLHQSRTVRRIDDGTWERLVEALRREYKVAGIGGQVGRVREWASDADTKGSTPLTVRAVPDGDRDRLEITEGTEQLFLVPKILGGIMLGNAALVGLLMLLGTSASGPPVGLPVAFALIGALVFGGGMTISKVVAGKRARRLEAVADRLALIASGAYAD